MENRYGGNVSIQEINSIFLNNAKRYRMNYSHKKENRWNLWEDKSGMTLSFTLNNGVFIPALVGIKRQTLERFYSTCPSNVDGWVKADIDIYYKTLRELIENPQQQRLPKEIEKTKKLVKAKRPTRRKKTDPIPGQLSLFDVEDYT